MCKIIQSSTINVNIQFQDPEYGYDFVVNHHSPTPKKFLMVLRSSHGTQCSGIIGMQANNKICGVGIAPLVTLGGDISSSNKGHKVVVKFNS